MKRFIIVALVFQSLLGHAYSSFHTTNLVDVLQQAAGIYSDLSRIQKYDSYFQKQLSRSVLVTAANHAYIAHTHNFLCYMKALGLKTLILSLDDRSYKHFSNAISSSHSILSNSSLSLYRLRGTEEVTGDAASFREPQFNLISVLKIKGAVQIMELGYNVLFMDPDIAVVQDPIPYMLWRDIDYVHSVNQRCGSRGVEWTFQSKDEGNTGLYYIMSNNKTIALMHNVIKKSLTMPEIDDQTVFWKGLRNGEFGAVTSYSSCRDSSDSNSLVLCALNGCQFSPGSLVPKERWFDLLKNELKRAKLPLVTVHANYIQGIERKQEAMRDRGFWLTGWPESHTCWAYNSTM